MAVRFKRLTASVSACPFQTLHALFQTDGLHPPAIECPPFGRNEVKEKSEVTRGGNSSSGKVEYVGLSPYFNPSVSAVLCGSQSI